MTQIEEKAFINITIRLPIELREFVAKKARERHVNSSIYLRQVLYSLKEKEENGSK
jgi:hypothetical protein